MQEIIVYRNPLEKALWDAALNMPWWFYFLIMAILVGVMVGVPIANYINRKRRGY